MLVNTEDLISLTEANQNFSKVVRKVDEKGAVIIMKNNNPSYVVIDFRKLEELQASSKDRMETLASKILKDNLDAFRELTKKLGIKIAEGKAGPAFITKWIRDYKE
jgi:antitoxin Phd